MAETRGIQSVVMGSINGDNGVIQVLNHQVNMMRMAPSQTLKRKLVNEIFESMEKILGEEPDSEFSVNDVFSSLLIELGPGDAQMREGILRLLHQVSFGHQDLLRVLPATFAEGDQGIWLDIFRRLLRKETTLLIPILECMLQLPIPDELQEEAWTLGFVGFDSLSESDLPKLIQILIHSDFDLPRLIRRVRDLFMDRTFFQNNQSELHVLEAFMDGFENESSRSSLSEAYETALQDICDKGDSRTAWVALDWICFLRLYKIKHRELSLNKMVDAMLSSQTLNWETLQQTLKTISQGKTKKQLQKHFSKKLGQPLIRLALHILLSPLRLSGMASESSNSVIQFILNLSESLTRDCQSEMIQSLLHIMYDTSLLSMAQMESRAIITQNTIRALESITQEHPGAVLNYHRTLKQGLTDTECSTKREAIEATCRILVKLVHSEGPHGVSSGIDPSELIMLVQKLLFSSNVFHVRGSDSSNAMTIRGLILAKEVLQISSLSKIDEDCLFKWVTQVILPPSGRFVSACFGSIGLNILKDWSERKERDVRIHKAFELTKALLSRSGLVKLRDTYEKFIHVDQRVVLSDSERVGDSDFREMVFAFTDYSNAVAGGSLEEILDSSMWIHDLVDTYLRFGREKAGKGWKPDGWLTAPIELPLPRSEGLNSIVLRFIESSVESIQSTDTRLISTKTASGAYEKGENLRYLYQLLHSYALCISIVSATLENATRHYNAKGVEDKRLSGLLLTRTSSLFALRERFSVLQSEVYRLSLNTETQTKSSPVSNSIGASLSDKFLSPGLLYTCLGLCAEEVRIRLRLGKDINGLVDAALDSGDNILIGKLELMVCLCEVLRTRWDPEMCARVLFGSCFLTNTRSLVRHLPILRKAILSNSSLHSRRIIQLLSSSCTASLSLISRVLEMSFGGKDEGLCSMILSVFWKTDGNSLTEHSNHYSGVLNELLGDCDDLYVADRLLEIHGIICSHFRRHLESAQAHFRAMFTIYDQRHSGKGIHPFIPQSISRHWEDIRKSVPAKEMNLIYRPLMHIFEEGCEIPSFAVQKRMIIQYLWLSLVGGAEKDLVQGIGKLVREMDAYVQMLGEDTLTSTSDENSNTTRSRKKKRVRSSLQALTMGVYVKFFHLLFAMIAFGSSQLQPQKSKSDWTGEYGPYTNFLHFASLFRSLLSMYKENFNVFPPSEANNVAGLAKLYLEVVNVWIHRAIDWRSRQPLLNPGNGQRYDPGAVKYVKKLLEGLSQFCIGPLISICRMWNILEAKDNKKTRSPNLNTAIEKTKKLITDVCSSHTLTVPRFECNLEKHVALEVPVKDVIGYHEKETIPDGSKSRVTDVEGNTPDLAEKTKRPRKKRITLINVSTTTSMAPSL